MSRRILYCLMALMVQACCATPPETVATAEQPVTRHVSMQQYRAETKALHPVTYNKDELGVTQPGCQAHFNDQLAAAQAAILNHRRM